MSDHIRRDGTVRAELVDKYVRYLHAKGSKRSMMAPPAPYATWSEMEADLRSRGQLR